MSSRSTSRRPLLEGARLAWILALASGAAFAVAAWLERLPSWAAMAGHLVMLSLLTGVLFAWDKHRARQDARRVSEANLLWLALLGGAAGAWVGMVAFRHKTRRLAFRVLVPVAVLLQATALAWLVIS